MRHQQGPFRSSASTWLPRKASHHSASCTAVLGPQGCCPSSRDQAALSTFCLAPGTSASQVHGAEAATSLHKATLPSLPRHPLAFSHQTPTDQVSGAPAQIAFQPRCRDSGRPRPQGLCPDHDPKRGPEDPPFIHPCHLGHFPQHELTMLASGHLRAGGLWASDLASYRRLRALQDHTQK